MGAPCGEETLLQVDPEWPAGGVCRVSGGPPEVLDAAITITQKRRNGCIGCLASHQQRSVAFFVNYLSKNGNEEKLQNDANAIMRRDM